MTPLQVIFIVTAAVILISAWLVVTRRNLIHAALFLVLTLFGVAVLFVLLEAGYLAVVQVIVYIGAISILMIFAVMFTRSVTGEGVEAFNKNAGWGALLIVFVFEGLVVTISGWPKFNALSPAINADRSLEILGEKMLSADGFVIPTLAIGMLLLAALIGAVVIAWQRKNKGVSE